MAATVLARAGARVRCSTAPRFRVTSCVATPSIPARSPSCGVSIWPRPVEAAGLRIDGMRVTGPGGVTIDGRYPDGLYGRALLRRDLDWALVQQAVEAGVQFEPALPVRRAIVEQSGATRTVDRRHRRRERSRAGVAGAGHDRGRRPAIHAGVFARPRASPTRAATLGHRRVLRGRGGTLVAGRDAHQPRRLCRRRAGARRTRERLPRETLATGRSGAARAGAPADGRARAGSAACATDSRALDWCSRRSSSGRWPSTCRRHAISGLLLAGDAAGFIDPMTGDGLRFAVRGGVLAAARRARRVGRWLERRARAARRQPGAGSSARSGGSTARCARPSHRRPPCRWARSPHASGPGCCGESSAPPETAEWLGSRSSKSEREV